MSMTQRFHYVHEPTTGSRDDLTTRISHPEIIRLTCHLQGFEVRATPANSQQEWLLVLHARGCGDSTKATSGISAFTIEDRATSESEFALMHQHFTELMAHKIALVVESEKFALADATLTLICPTYYAPAKVPRDCDSISILSGGLLSKDMIYAAANSSQTETPLPKKAPLNPNFTFNNFVTCESNQLAIAAASFVAATPKESGYYPLVLQGGRGTGKTHLLHAIGNNFQATHTEEAVIYLTAEQFAFDFVSALHSKSLNEYQTYLCSADLLLIDDTQTLARKAELQIRLTEIINALANNGRQVVLASDRFLPRLDQHDNDFKRQARQWLVGQLGMPDLEARVAVLQQLSEFSQIALPDKVAMLIAERADADMHELRRVMQMVITQARFLKQPISIKMVNQAMTEH